MNRYMALDVGDRTIGVAISDPLFIMASGHSTIFRENLEKDLEILKDMTDLISRREFTELRQATAERPYLLPAAKKQR